MSEKAQYRPFCGTLIDTYSETRDGFKCYTCAEEFVVLSTQDHEALLEDAQELRTFGDHKVFRENVLTRSDWVDENREVLVDLLASLKALP